MREVEAFTLANEFSFLPPQILASTLPTLSSTRSIPSSTVPTNLHVKPMLLSQGLFEGVHDRQSIHSPFAELS